VASDQATFGTPEINVGLFPFMIMALIYRNVPRKKANEMLLLGGRMDAKEAKEAGIVNHVAKAKEFDLVLEDWTRMLASKSPLIMKLGKDAMWRQMDMDLAEALDYLRSQLAIELSSEDAIEGVKAFFEKREPEWKGR
jgi:enoyl-CoA hydratase/carnithine racemase